MAFSLWRLTKRFLAPAVAVVVTVACLQPSPVSAEGVFAGACSTRIQASFGSPLRNLPTSQSAILTGTGLCVVNGIVAPFEFYATVGTTPATGGFGCLSGLMTGVGVVDIDVPGFPGPLVEVQVLNVGGVWTMVLTSLLLTFEGVGELVPEPGAMVACATSSLARATWTGPLAFQDPYPPPV